jgi:hypothetical protein
MKWMCLLLPVLLVTFTLQLHAEESELPRFVNEDYAEILTTYVDEHGMVDYRSLKEDREKLDDFTASLGQLDSAEYDSWDDNSKIAFLINAYNALTLTLIIDHYPIKASFFKSFIYPKNSIRQISGAWDKISFTVMGIDMTLDHIEHEILRKDFNEPRIHMAIVCASKGCAKLANEPYTGDQIDEQLDSYTHLFVNNPEKIRIDVQNKTVYLSKYFQWFGEDFIPTYGTDEEFTSFNETERAALNFIRNYLNEDERLFLNEGEYTIEILSYDWSLNEQEEK